MKENFLKKQTGLNKTIVLNVFSTALLQGIAFFTIPIFTRILGSEQYGLYAIFNSWVSIFTIILSLGIGNSIASGRYYFKDEYYGFRNNIVAFDIVVSGTFVLFLLVLYPIVNILLEYNMRIYTILLLTSFSSNVIGCITGVLVYEKKAILNTTLAIFLTLSNVILSLIFIYCLNLDNLYEGRVYGHFIPYFLASIFLAFYMLSTKIDKLDIKYLKYGLTVGGPIVFHQIANYLLSQSDRVMMQKMNIPNSDIGIYSLFYSFTGVVLIILGALNTSFAPFYADYIDQDDKENMISKSRNFIELFTIISIGFILLSREVSYIMADKEYYAGINMIPIFVGSTYFIFMYQFAVNYEFYYRKTKTIACATMGAAGLNVVLNIYFISGYGMYGAAYATIISYAALFIFHYIVAKSLPNKRFYVSAREFVPWLAILISIIYLFYKLESETYIRWIIGLCFGIYELVRIIKRKKIF